MNDREYAIENYIKGLVFELNIDDCGNDIDLNQIAQNIMVLKGQFQNTSALRKAVTGELASAIRNRQLKAKQIIEVARKIALRLH